MRKEKMKKGNMNYLDMVPKINDSITWSKSGKTKGFITLSVMRKKGMEKIFRKLFKTPDRYTLDLDAHGSFVWQCIDGHNSVYDISELVSKEFGDGAEPLLDRLVTFMRILRNNNFISYEKVERSVS